MYQKPRDDERSGFVRDAKRSLLQAADEILGPRGLRPGDVPDDLLSDVMGSPGEPDTKLLHGSLFPAESGSIGTVDPISVRVAEQGLVAALMEERTGQLIHAMPREGGIWTYVYMDEKGDRRYEHTNAAKEDDISIILACVVNGIEEKQEQRKFAAQLASEHFASRMSKEADPQGGEKPGKSSEVANPD